MVTQKLKKVIYDGLEKTLTEIYQEENIKSGDITPEQLRVWNSIVDDATNLFKELIAQNK